jgi:hypothetical protein
MYGRASRHYALRLMTRLAPSARAHFLKSGDEFYEIALQLQYSRFAKLCDSNRL